MTPHLLQENGSSDSLHRVPMRLETCERCSLTFETTQTKRRHCSRVCWEQDYYAANREKWKAYSSAHNKTRLKERAATVRAYRAANQAELAPVVAASAQAYREANRQLLRDKAKAYHAANRDKMRAKNKAWYATNREYMARKSKARNPERRAEIWDELAAIIETTER